MRYFFRLTSISLQSHLYYRTSFLLNLLPPIVLLFGQYMLWGALYGQQGGTIGSMTQREMFTYILIAFSLNNLLGWFSENILAKEIRSGMVVARCLRPVPFLVQSVSEMTGALAFQALVNLLVVLAGFGLFGSRMEFPEAAAVAAFIPCVILAVLLRIMIIDVFSLLCFFSTGYLGISWTRAALFDFFSGAMVPVAMFPGWLACMARYTPFPYMIQVPISVLLGDGTGMNIVQILGTQAAWLAVLVLFHCLLYSCARKNMTIAGG